MIMMGFVRILTNTRPGSQQQGAAILMLQTTNIFVYPSITQRHNQQPVSPRTFILWRIKLPTPIKSVLPKRISQNQFYAYATWRLKRRDTDIQSTGLICALIFRSVYQIGVFPATVSAAPGAVAVAWNHENIALSIELHTCAEFQGIRSTGNMLKINYKILLLDSFKAE